MGLARKAICLRFVGLFDFGVNVSPLVFWAPFKPSLASLENLRCDDTLFTLSNDACASKFLYLEKSAVMSIWVYPSKPPEELRKAEDEALVGLAPHFSHNCG